ncbi:transcriptional regulator, MarR family [Geobacter metallireducens RCH3]|uniref:Winged helix-turn-helix transcriptional regulator, MarR family n=1 Tax=Geobacter metallireducens (strain ATCC 53774 / DSM 7210 / GS-15) TaxID=269799 RepID=Q39YS2_GEOMG|nr:MarR family transcriptional regulator [Geobacter metallireducens]ABB30602.1 winged helix-turn-helix transcriptional regulator, MarR family [Geobacter metallireducens GS-15]EHP87989.1 transcriptional regulator, MarR family [Geobacter metallireducens RCH3]
MNLSDEKIGRSNLFYRLGLLTRHWRQVLDTDFQFAGLTDATWRPLLHLHLLGDGTRQKDLAASIGIEGPSLVRLLDTLIAKGLIERLEDVTDRRAKLLNLTPEGRVIVARIQETVTALENDLLSPFSDDEIARVAEFIERLESTVNEARRRGKR